MTVPPIRYPITFLPVHNLEETIHFYNEILQLSIALKQSKCVIFQVGQSPHFAYWGFCSHDQEFLTPSERVCLTLVVNSPAEVDRWYDYLIKHRIKCKKPPHSSPEFHIYNSFYHDPMNYTLEIQAFDEKFQPLGA